MEIQQKRDPYNAIQAWERWKQRNEVIKDISKDNSDLILSCLKDMEEGKNVSRKRRGNRSPIRLLSLQCRLVFFARLFGKKKFTDVSKDDLHKLFKEMRDGKIKKKDSKGKEIGNYTSVDCYLKDFRVLWNWLRKTGRVKEDITEDLGKGDEKPPWVYLTEEQFKTLANRCSAEYRPLVWLMLDCGARVTEGFSIKVNDFNEDFTKLTLREETSKNKYGRTINLKLCSAFMKDYVKFHNLKKEDFLFQKNPQAFNNYLKRLSESLFGKGVSHPKAKGTYDKFTLYDIRHNASCYWLKRYKAHTPLMYRMAWFSETFIRYYSEFLGLNDEITDEDMVIAEDRTKLEKLERNFEDLKKQREEDQKVIKRLIKALSHKVEILGQK